MSKFYLIQKFAFSVNLILKFPAHFFEFEPDSKNSSAEPSEGTRVQNFSEIHLQMAEKTPFEEYQIAPISHVSTYPSRIKIFFGIVHQGQYYYQ